MKKEQTQETIDTHLDKVTENPVNLPKPIAELLSMLEDKYCDLVWYARKPTDGIGKIWEENDWYKKLDKETVEAVRNGVKKVAEAYPTETYGLAQQQIPGLDISFSDYQNGFNAGMLALTRMLESFTSEDKEYRKLSVELFPITDS